MARAGGGHEEAIEEFEALLAEEAVVADRKAAIRGWLEGSGQRSLQHAGEEIGWAAKAGSRFDKKALVAHLEARGDGIDLAEYEKPATPTFGRRKAK